MKTIAPTPQEITRWLDKTGRTRSDLAKELNVSFGTVKGWLSANRPISGAALKLLQMLMTPSPVINPQFTLEEWNKMEALAKAEGLNARQWINSVLKRELNPETPSKPLAPTVKAGLSTRQNHIAADVVPDTSDEPPAALVHYPSIQAKKEA